MADQTSKAYWVFCDIRNERHFKLCLKVLAKARELAQTVEGKVAAFFLAYPDQAASGVCKAAPSCLSLDTAAQTCIDSGADFAYILSHPELCEVRPDLYALACASVIRTKSPELVLFPLTDFGRDMAARTSSLLKSGLIADCIDLSYEANNIVASCPSWGGKIMAQITFSDPEKTGFATVTPHGVEPVSIKGDPGVIEQIPIDHALGTEDTKNQIRLISSNIDSSDHRKLEEAQTVVVGGAGLGNVDGFALVRDLAAVLGGQVGATRPPVLQHWVDEDRLIGQTGKTVHPNLLFTIGTSGAVQYTAGITESKNIVAINRDPNSPIFQIADIGIVADAKQFLPVFNQKIKQIVMRQLTDMLCESPNMAAVTTGFGAKVKSLRESHDWTAEHLAEATGQTPEFIEQVETDQIVPSVSFLLRLARALEVDPGTFLKEEEKSAIKDRRAKEFIKRTQNYSYQTLTPEAQNQHLRVFLITIESKQAHKPVAYKHEGEEYVYVMEGELELTLGNKIFHLKPHESKHFNSEISHKLKSLSNESTRCLVVLYTP